MAGSALAIAPGLPTRRRCLAGFRLLVAPHHGAAGDRNPVDILREAPRDPVAIGNRVAAEAVRIVHAGLLLFLGFRRRGNRCERKERECERDLNFHMPVHWSMAAVPSSPAIFHFLPRKAP